MIQYIHEKWKEKKKITDHHNTSVKNVQTERKTMCGEKVRPSTESIGNSNKKKKKEKKPKKKRKKNDDKNSKNPKSWLRSFQAAAKRDPIMRPQGRAVLSSLLSPSFSLFVLLPSLIV